MGGEKVLPPQKQVNQLNQLMLIRIFHQSYHTVRYQFSGIYFSDEFLPVLSEMYTGSSAICLLLYSFLYQAD